jgi:gamma-glutamylcyclotransferase
MPSLVYFAYGPNLDADQMQMRCPTARPVARARLTDYRLAFTHPSRRWRGGSADIVPAAGQAVWGVIYALERRDLERLDRFEGGYERLEVEVEDSDGRVHAALTYTVREKGSFAPTEEYLSKILRWGKHWGLPSPYLREVERLGPVPTAHPGEDEAL